MPDVRAQWTYYFHLLDPRPGLAVLDVGCHVGDAIQLLVDLHPGLAHVVGVDRNESKYLAAKDRFAANPDVDILRADAMSLPLSDAAFERVYCAETLEWVDDPVGALREIRRVLAPRGRALITHSDFDTQVFASSDLALTRRIVHAFTDAGERGTIGRDLRAACKAAGFSQVEPTVYPLLGFSLAPDRYPYRILSMMRTWMADSGTVTESEFDRWRDDLEQRAARGEFYYSINRNMCVCTK